MKYLPGFNICLFNNDSLSWPRMFLCCFSPIPLYFCKVGFVSWLLQSVFYQIGVRSWGCLRGTLCNLSVLRRVSDVHISVTQSKWVPDKWQLCRFSSGQCRKTEHKILSIFNTKEAVTIRSHLIKAIHFFKPFCFLRKLEAN